MKKLYARYQNAVLQVIERADALAYDTTGLLAVELEAVLVLVVVPAAMTTLWLLGMTHAALTLLSVVAILLGASLEALLLAMTLCPLVHLVHLTMLIAVVLHSTVGAS